MDNAEKKTPETQNEEIRIHFFKSEEDNSRKRVRFYQNFKKGQEACYFDLISDVPYRIEKNARGATAENPLTLVLNMKDHGYAGKFQVMAFASPFGTDFHPPTTMLNIQFGDSGNELVGRIFDNSIFSRLDL